MARTARTKRKKPQVSDPTKIDPDPAITQFDIQKGVEDDKRIRPQQVFEGYKDPKSGAKKNRKAQKSNKKGLSSKAGGI